MDTLVAQLAPSRRGDEGSSSTAEWANNGYGNLDASGAVAGMDVPGVPDVSITQVW